MAKASKPKQSGKDRLKQSIMYNKLICIGIMAGDMEASAKNVNNYHHAQNYQKLHFPQHLNAFNLLKLFGK